MLDLSRLNEAQKRAVLHGNTPLLVLAGAGTGKTTVLTYRIAHLVLDQGVDPRRILAVTFTNKAAKEMRIRAAKQVGVPESTMDIGTFHGICGRILRQYSERVGLAPGFTILDSSDQLSLMKRCLEEMNIDPQIYPAKSMLQRLDHWKSRGLRVKDVQPSAFDPIDKTAHRVYSVYQKKCLESNAVDFNDMLLSTLTLLKDNDDVRMALQQRWTHVLVDEYQDTNPVQYQILHSLITHSHGVTVVGDDDQSIYRWRGADIGNILRFEQDFPGAMLIRLEHNYRSSKNILDAANAVISNNVARKGKTLFTDVDAGSKLRFTMYPTDRDEGDIIARNIAVSIGKGTCASDIAIMYRTNAQSRAIEDGLRRARVPYVIFGGMRFYDRKEVKDALAYLRLLINPQSNVDFFRIINTPPRGIGKTSLTHIDDLAKRHGISLMEAAKRAVADPDVLAGKARSSVANLLAAIETYSTLAETKSLDALLEAYLTDVGYLTQLRAEVTAEAADRLENLGELINALKEYGMRTEGATLLGFLEEVALASDLDLATDDDKAVNMMTLHTAKGLEFDTVYLPGLEEGLFPHGRSLDDHAALEEERRLCYVGLTRAKRDLHLSATRLRNVFGESRPATLSRFMSEIPVHLLEAQATQQPRVVAAVGSVGGRTISKNYTFQGDRPVTPAMKVRSAIQTKAQDNDPFSCGAKVFHATFGEGIVAHSEGGGAQRKLTVDFPRAGQKVIVARFLELR